MGSGRGSTQCRRLWAMATVATCRPGDRAYHARSAGTAPMFERVWHQLATRIHAI